MGKRRGGGQCVGAESLADPRARQLPSPPNRNQHPRVASHCPHLRHLGASKAGSGGGAGREAGRVSPKRVWPSVRMVSIPASGSSLESVDQAAARRAERVARRGTQPALRAPGRPAPLPAALPPQPQAGCVSRCLRRASESGMMRASQGPGPPGLGVAARKPKWGSC